MCVFTCTLSSQDYKSNTTSCRVMLPYSQHVVADTSVKVGASRRSRKWLTDPEGSFLFLVSKKGSIHQNWCSPLGSSLQTDSSLSAVNPEQTYSQRRCRWNRELASSANQTKASDWLHALSITSTARLLRDEDRGEKSGSAEVRSEI